MILQNIILLLVAITVVFLIFQYRKSMKVDHQQLLDADLIHEILTGKVKFYQHLTNDQQIVFLKRVAYFLQKIKITPIKGALVTTEDCVLIAAAGIIPLFRFENWFYNNLDEILVYPDRFNKDYTLEGEGRAVVGMVGDGAMHRTMILSLPYLRAGFNNDTTNNTAIHEFVHLLDKSDGATDGIPEIILQDENVKPWIVLMHNYIKQIRTHEGDINSYGATNEAEFFAVVSEYFFQQPEQLKKHHPDLYHLLDLAFNNKQSI